MYREDAHFTHIIYLYSKRFPQERQKVSPGFIGSPQSTQNLVDACRVGVGLLPLLAKVVIMAIAKTAAIIIIRFVGFNNNDTISDWCVGVGSDSVSTVDIGVSWGTSLTIKVRVSE